MVHSPLGCFMHRKDDKAKPVKPMYNAEQTMPTDPTKTGKCSRMAPRWTPKQYATWTNDMKQHAIGNSMTLNVYDCIAENVPIQPKAMMFSKSKVKSSPKAKMCFMGSGHRTDILCNIPAI